MLSLRQLSASCAGGRFGSESNWRSNIWEQNLDPLFFRLAARVSEGSIWDITHIVNGLFGNEALFFITSPATLPIGPFIRFITQPHFPYGVSVLPDH